ncbi:prepilin-type N-terminal cleavage/methylation domain-containing protein [Pseudothauera rhizosphaerae]|uniref:Prepilin-type N-terminal cleavage/methylation domain-containing protein n=1 Tax=Pseudothauera rhizosphaerae TaxID=2565932 RepID=A0A4S4AS85_9RHOO|nr:prepilin-type N-terminal cleavage/methylation domain-containing protein [Pseudothauera rhizosphaerae]THF62690.1 prepilin-type N-terminal cleavage/methylation domain-containing protein [Pseudothauera rhizosphaerae]
MSIAQLFGFKSDKHVAAKLAAVETHQVSGKLRSRLAALKKKEGGFTLLELLVVVAILAAVAGTATIILRDTDRQASAAAHVAMMDELSKGILTYRVLNNGQYPDNFDSLFVAAAADLTTITDKDTNVSGVVNVDLAEPLEVATLTEAEADRLNEYGITQLRVIGSGIAHGAFNCAGTYAQAVAEPSTLPADGIRALINSRSNDVTNSNIFRPAGANGCGLDASAPIVDAAKVLVWDTSDQGNADRIKVPLNTTVYAFGIGPDSTLFDPQTRGALNNTPTYRHVTQDEYNRFVGLFGVNETTDEIELIAVVDGAGDTKDEELGEWDGTRSTL